MHRTDEMDLGIVAVHSETSAWLMPAEAKGTWLRDPVAARPSRADPGVGFCTDHHALVQNGEPPTVVAEKLRAS